MHETGGPVHSVLLVDMFYPLVCVIAKFYTKFSYFPVNTYIMGTKKNTK